MNAQDLKNSILQLAVQGKLVEQRAEEGTARELLEQIKLEKDQLIKDKKIKKSKPLPEITEEEIPYEIPESWEWVRLGNIIILQSGQDLQPAFYNSEEKGIPYLTGASNIEDGNIIINRWTESPKAIANQGDLLLTCKGTVGKTTLLNLSEVHIARQIMGIRTLGASILYIKLFVESQITYLKSKAKSMIPGIERNNVLNLCIPVPPLEEQHRIVAKIEEILPYIDQYDKAYTKLETFNKKFPEDMEKSILQMAMQGKLVEQRPEEGTADELYEQIVAEKAQLIKDGKIKKEKPLPEITEDEIPFEIPSSWKWVRFQEVCAVLTCGYASTPEYVAENIGMPFISAKNIKPYKFMPDDHKYIKRELYDKLTQTCCPKKNDILLTRVGAGIGEAAIIDIDMEFAIYVSLTLIKLVDYKQLDNRYILYWLNSPIGTDNARKNIFGKGASQGNLNVNNVRTFLVPLPPLEEQKRIVAKVDELLPYCDQLIK
ncbi:restriction endonuclease [Clostridium sp. BIOML-A1]|uniref:restriction endonuclease subunit S n=1 Tax=Clostridium sp. BIOML-A1 TaxID=2584627 RepID=UPI00136BAD0B|nr:restriction endonuclease subunit S [Clostridium sp. BIOML-A1]MZH17912.1 restriction endonuclease [Clostridium sp. BIOML-A1]